MQDKNKKIEDLEKIAKKFSKQIIEMTTKAGSGHPSSSLSAIDILVLRYFGDVMKFRMIGDGETNEGQIWEAAMAAAKFQTDNPICILDDNKFQQTGPVRKVMPSIEPLNEKPQIRFGR